MKVIDWLELKEGEIFTVEEPTAQWHTQFSSLRAGKVRGGFIATLSGACYQMIPNDANRHRFYTPWNRTRDEYIKSKQFAQKVHVYEPKDNVPLDLRIEVCTPRVNGTTGADPEMFVVRGATESLLPAFLFLDDKKTAKKKFDGTHAYAYWDGFAAEYSIQAGSCHGYMIDHLRRGLSKIRSAAKKFDRTAELTIQNTMIVPDITMKEATDDQVALGCLPSLHAYNDEPQPSLNSRDALLRFTGGHIHFGIDYNIVKKHAVDMVKGCDLIIGVPAVALFASFDTPTRRFYYGRAGEFRTPAHGLEYRTLSNAWLADPVISHLVLNLARCGLKIGKAGLHTEFGLSESEVQGIINNCDVQKAREWTLKNLPLFDRLLELEGIVPGKNFKRVIEGGMEAIVPDPTKVAQNWKLEGDWCEHSDGSRATWSATSNHAVISR